MTSRNKRLLEAISERELSNALSSEERLSPDVRSSALRNSLHGLARPHMFSTTAHIKLSHRSLTEVKHSTTERTATFPAFRSSVIHTKHDLLLALKDLRKLAATPTIHHARSVFNILSALAQEPGYYQEELQVLIAELRKVLFCPKNLIPDRVQQYISQQEVDILIQEDGLIPYFYLTRYLNQLVDLLSMREKDTESTLLSKISSLEQRLSAKETEADSLKIHIRHLAEDRKPLELDRERLKEKVAITQNTKLVAEVNSLASQLKKAEEKCNSLKQTLKEDMGLIADLEKRLAQQKQIITEGTVAYRALESELAAAQNENSELEAKYKQAAEATESMQRRFESSGLIRLRGMDEGELTPRCRFEEVYDALGLERQNFPSTREFALDLTRNIQNLQQAVARSRPRRRTGAPVPIDTRGRASTINDSPISPVIHELAP